MTACTQNDRLGEAVILSAGTPIPAQCTRRRRCRYHVTSSVGTWACNARGERSPQDGSNKNQHSVLRMAPNDADNTNLDAAKQRIKDRAIMRNHNSMALEVGDTAEAQGR